jgi:hypothetical protein
VDFDLDVDFNLDLDFDLDPDLDLHGLNLQKCGDCKKVHV